MANKPLTDKKINEVYNFLNKYVEKDAALHFRKADDKVQWIKDHWSLLEEYEPWTNKYSSLKDLTATPKEQLEAVYNKNPDITKISSPRLKTILEGNDFTEDELRDYYDWRESQKAAMNKFNKERYEKLSDEYAQVERSKDKSYFNSPLANEYAREAYIKGDTGRAKLQEVLGKTAGAVDFAPFPVSLAGPATRTFQKYLADKPIITAGTAADIGGAVIPDFAEKPARMAWNYGKGILERVWRKAGDSKLAKQIEHRVQAADELTAAQKAQKAMDISNANLDELTDKQLLDLYNASDDAVLKSKIEAYHKARQERAKAVDIAESDYAKANGYVKRQADAQVKSADAAVRQAEQDFTIEAANRQPLYELLTGKNKVEPYVGEDFVRYYKDVPLSEIARYEELKDVGGAGTAGLYNVLTLGGRKAARSTIGGRAGQWDTFDPTPADNTDKAVDWVISTYSDSWDPAIKPKNYDEPLIKAAYDKWRSQNKTYFYKDWRK
jgi:hypothetical protein